MSESLLSRTKARMQELGLQPQKGLGQNFLISRHVVDKIIHAVAAQNPRQLLEVGPGVGSLTESLLEMNLPLTIIELDRSLAEYWRKRGQNVLENDALKVNWAQAAPVAPTVLVSNLPYQISTHLVIDLSFGPATIPSMVLMFQKEVAERLMARPRTSAYGLLSVMLQSHWQMQRVLEAGPGDFWPAPKIASQVVQFQRKPAPFAGREKAYLSYLKAAFAQRRKFLSKNLLARPPKPGLNQEAIVAALEELGLGSRVRAEELSVEQFEKLFERIGQ
ncbi:MAG: 16S rRNA (adenine(1518)-N(6)/adenine(1519)-N(6))-dimethyltransferase RsmA [Bdellovibrionales bacterium]